MHIVWTILIGFVVGLIARAVTPGAGPSGFLLTSALGIAGSIGATWIGQAMGWYQAGEGAGFIGALIGAVILLVVYHLIARKSST
ncbi:MAG: GlsB/YeaQ/YmgE family stress response membrane protein [Casimicrobiaceae bacterium]